MISRNTVKITSVAHNSINYCDKVIYIQRYIIYTLIYQYTQGIHQYKYINFLQTNRKKNNNNNYIFTACRKK